MEDAKVRAALGALDDLIRSELSATDAGRYHRAERVLTLAANLARLHVRRVADAVDQEMGQGDDDGLHVGMMEDVGGFGQVGVRRAHRFVAPAEDLVRQLADALPRIVAAQQVGPPGRQLADLLDVRERLNRPEDAVLRTRVQARIAALVDVAAALPAPVGTAGPAPGDPVADPAQVDDASRGMTDEELEIEALGADAAVDHAVDAALAGFGAARAADAEGDEA